MTFDSVVVEICKHSLNVRITRLGVHVVHVGMYMYGCVHVQLQLCVCVCVYVKFEVNIVQCVIL